MKAPRQDRGDEPKWRFTDSAAPNDPPPPPIESPLSADEAALNMSWMRLQIIHTAFRAADQKDYLSLTDALQALERLFLERHDSLNDYYRECFAPEQPPTWPGAPLGGPSSVDIDHV